MERAVRAISSRWSFEVPGSSLEHTLSQPVKPLRRGFGVDGDDNGSGNGDGVGDGDGDGNGRPMNGGICSRGRTGPSPPAPKRASLSTMALLADPALLRHRSLPSGPTPPPPDIDQRVTFHGMSWKDYEIMLAIRGDRAGVRMAYLNGAIELMSPSLNHEGVKKTIGRLVEAYADERGLDINGYGSWTLKNALVERGLEPDECYVLGASRKEIPELAIEVVWTSGGLDKLEIYRALGVGEVWRWERGGGITVHLLRDSHYEVAERSALLPDLDLRLLERFATTENQSQGVRDFRAALRKAPKASKQGPSRPRASTPSENKRRATPTRTDTSSRRAR